MRILLSTLMLAGMLLSSLATAKTYYVSDQLWVNLRSGPGSEYRIIRVLKSGTALEFQEETEDKEWIRVTTNREEDGWIPIRYLQENPIAKQILAATQKELDKVKAELATTRNNYSKVSGDAKSSDQELSGLKSENDQLKKELAEIKTVAADELNLKTNNRQLLEENQSLKNQIDVLTVENQTLQDRSDSEKWIIGAAILCVGLLLGLIIPRLRSGNRGNSWA